MTIFEDPYAAEVLGHLERLLISWRSSRNTRAATYFRRNVYDNPVSSRTVMLLSAAEVDCYFRPMSLHVASKICFSASNGFLSTLRKLKGADSPCMVLMSMPRASCGPA